MAVSHSKAIAQLECLTAIQTALANQPIDHLYALIGDQLQAVFHPCVVHIIHYDQSQQTKTLVYPQSSSAIALDSTDRTLLQQREVLFSNPTVENFLRWVLIPLQTQQHSLGSILIQIEGRTRWNATERAFCQNIAHTLQNALERAHLMRENQQRTAELAIINAVQMGLIEKLAMPLIYELVGDTIVEVFQSDVVMISTFNHDCTMAFNHYLWDEGARATTLPPLPPGPLADVVIATHQPLILLNLNEVRQYVDHFIVDGTLTALADLPAEHLPFISKSLVSMPMFIGERINGIVGIQSYREHAFDDNAIRLLQTLTNTLSIALENARLFNETQHQAREIAAIAAVGRDISATLDQELVLQRIAQYAAELLHADSSAVYLQGQEEDLYQAVTAVGKDNEAILQESVVLGEGIIGASLLKQQPERIASTTMDPRSIHIPNTTFDEQGERMMVMPLLYRSFAIGAMVVWRSHHGAEFSDDDLRFFSGLGQQAEIAIQNARLFAEVATARVRAEAADAAKSEFLSNVSHELRTPLTSVLGFAKVIQKDLTTYVFPQVTTPNPKVKRAVAGVSQDLSIIVSEGERLTALINDVLDLAKIEAGQVAWNLQPLAINQVIEHALIASSTLFAQKPLTLKKDLADVPMIRGDADKLLQVVINLLSNAVKFSDSGTITCRVRSNNATIIVSVSDQGVGIAPEDHAVVFEKFKQIGDQLINKPKGTGLGLAICKEIIEHHGGQIWLESSLGQGSTFAFSLPTLSNED